MTVSYFVADTNIWIRQFLNPGGAADAALTKAMERHTPVFDRDTFEELRTRLERPKLAPYSTPEQRETFLKTTLEGAVFIDRTHEVQRARDPDDDKFLGLALTIGAAHVISSDKHLREIKHYQGVQIWSPEQFLQLERGRDITAELLEGGRQWRERNPRQAPDRDQEPETGQNRRRMPWEPPS